MQHILQICLSVQLQWQGNDPYYASCLIFLKPSSLSKRVEVALLLFRWGGIILQRTSEVSVGFNL